MTITATSDNQIRKSNIRNWTIGLQTFATGSLPRSGLVQRDVMEYWIGTAASVGLDVGRPDHLGPLFGVICDELSEIGGRADKRRASKVGKPRLHLGIGEAGVDLLVELVDDLRRRVLGYADAIPVARLITRQELTLGRDARQRLRALRGRHRQRPELARPNVLDGCRHCRKAYLYLPREEIGQSRPCAAIGHGHHINTSHYFEKLAGHMHRRTSGP